jgi:hypothetical protein
VSLPTMLVGFTRYSMDDSFSVIGRNKLFLLVMAAGSIVGTFIGGRMLGLVPNSPRCCWRQRSKSGGTNN